MKSSMVRLSINPSCRTPATWMIVLSGGRPTSAERRRFDGIRRGDVESEHARRQVGGCSAAAAADQQQSLGAASHGPARRVQADAAQSAGDQHGSRQADLCRLARHRREPRHEAAFGAQRDDRLVSCRCKFGGEQFSGVPGATSTKRQPVSGRSQTTAEAKPANPLAARSSAALRATKVSGGDAGRPALHQIERGGEIGALGRDLEHLGGRGSRRSRERAPRSEPPRSAASLRTAGGPVGPRHSPPARLSTERSGRCDRRPGARRPRRRL